MKTIKTPTPLAKRKNSGMFKVHFSGSPLNASIDKSEVPAPLTPCVYFLCDKGTKAPFYIGEYGQAKTYTVITRIKRHFSKSGTLARVSHNLNKFNTDLPSEFDAYIKLLPKRRYTNLKARQSLEAWIIHKICHCKKSQDAKFCVLKYAAPTENEAAAANNIIIEFESCV